MTHAPLRLLSVSLCAALLQAAPTHAFGGGGGGGDKKAESASNRIKASFEIKDDSRKPAPLPAEAGPRAIDMPMTVTPVFVDDILLGYLFLSIRVTVREGVDPWSVRERVHVLRDAIVRASHKTSIGVVDREIGLDEEAGRALVLAAASDVIGAGKIEGVEFIGVGAR